MSLHHVALNNIQTHTYEDKIKCNRWRGFTSMHIFASMTTLFYVISHVRDFLVNQAKKILKPLNMFIGNMVVLR